MLNHTTLPHGCWDCWHAEIEGDRPTGYTPGTTYRVRCPLQAGAMATSTMSADRGLMMPICVIGQWRSNTASENAVSLTTQLLTWLIRFNRLYEVDSVLEAQLPGRDAAFYRTVIEDALLTGVASGELESHWAAMARNILLAPEEVAA